MRFDDMKFPKGDAVLNLRRITTQ